MGKRLSRELENLFIKKRDAKLISEILNGNDLAFAKLIELYENRIRVIGARFFREKSDIDDFCQNVFLKTYTNLRSFKGNSLFSTWLTRIAFTTAMNEKERTKKTDSLGDDFDIASSEKTPEENQMIQEAKSAIREAVNQLPPEYAECINLFFFNGMSQADISIATGIPLNTVKSNVFRAKKLLAERLKDFK